MSDARIDSFRRLLRWYPTEWRAQNEDAMLGVMLDYADDAGRDRPTAGERVGYATGALRERLRFPSRGRRLGLLPFAFAAAMSLFYLWIAWSPNHSYTGYVGPFSNPSVIGCALLVLGFVAALTSQRAVASVLALGSAIVWIVSGVLAQSAGFMGPSGGTVVLYAGLSLVVAAPRLSGRFVAASAMAVVGVVVLAEFAPRLLDPYTNVMSYVACAIGVLIVAAAVFLFVRGRSIRSAATR